MGSTSVPASSERQAERHPGTVLGAWIGLAGIVLAALGGAVETLLTQPWPSRAGPALEVFLLENRELLRVQSMLFVLSAAASIWFLGYIRAHLLRAEGAPGTRSGIAFGAGLVTYGMIIVGQAAQLAVTLPGKVPTAEVAVVVEGICTATTALANIPAAVFFAASATLTFTHRALPAWLGWVAVLAAAASVLSGFALIPADGPLAPTGWLTTIARLVPILFYVPVAVLLMSRWGTAGQAAQPSAS